MRKTAYLSASNLRTQLFAEYAGRQINHCTHSARRLLPLQSPSARLLHDRHGITSLFLTGQLEAARSASDAAVGVISKPYDLDAVVRAVDTLAWIRLGQLPESLPPQLEVFG